MTEFSKKSLVLSMEAVGLLFVCFIFILLENGAEAENSIEGPVYTELENLKPSQKQALEKFKEIMSPIVPHDYMKEDIYLVKYMEYNKFNVQKAVDHFKETLSWREENKIDQLYTDPPDFITDFQKEYQVYNDGSDKEGRPICEVDFGHWPIRKAAVAGKLKNLMLYMFLNCGEKASERIREQQAQGNNITDWIFLSNMDGFSLIEQGCPTCLPMLMALTSGNEKYYPHTVHGIWTLNTPDSFATVARLVRPVMAAPTRTAFKVFSSNKAEWKPFLEKHVDMNEISDWFGGGKERK